MKKSRLIAGALALALSAQTAVLAACAGNSGPDTADPDATVTETLPRFSYQTYDNKDFSNYDYGDEKECDLIPGQWNQNGLGDPYVFRFNGVYYLYVSTKGGVVGVRGWRSTDLIHWEQCDKSGLEKGFVSTDSCLGHAYAPEVYYFNGKFYMYTSPDDKGHYTLVSDSPEGPFERVTQNYGMVIDGTMFIDDDESFYFLHASHEGLIIRPMEEPDSVPGAQTLLKNTTIGWTEGPMIIKRNGYYFLTYTGPEVKSPAYRVLYNTMPDGESLTDANAFSGKSNTPLLLETREEFSGLGHSSTVLGPDLDSYYLVYHNLHEVVQGSGACWRGYNFDRLIFNGSQMSMSGSDVNSIAATQPEFTANGTSERFEKSGSMYLSDTPTSKVFSAEYNFTGDKVKCIAGYTDASNYSYVLCDYENHKITLYSVKNGTEQKVSEGSLKHDFDPDALHTVRLAYADGVADVYFDNMCKINGAKTDMSAGKIGYSGGNVKFTAFSNVARGYSDRAELKQSAAEIGANTYLPEGQYEGLTSYKFSSGSGLTEYKTNDTADAVYNGATQLKLAKSGDFARYSVYFRERGKYGLVLTYDASYGGTEIGIQLNLDEIQKVTLPEVDSDAGEMVSVLITDVNITKNANLITIHSTGQSVEFMSFTFRSVSTGEFEESLTEQSWDMDYKTDYDITAEGHTTSSRFPIMAGWLGGRYADCEISVEMNMKNMNGKSAGLMLRADRLTLKTPDKEDKETCVQGYYVALSYNTVTLHKYNFNYSQKNLITATHSHSTGEWFTLKAEIKKNTITVYIDGEMLFSYTDSYAFASGNFGLYSNGAIVTYKNLNLTAN